MDSVDSIDNPCSFLSFDICQMSFLWKIIAFMFIYLHQARLLDTFNFLKLNIFHYGVHVYLNPYTSI